MGKKENRLYRAKRSTADIKLYHEVRPDQFGMGVDGEVAAKNFNEFMKKETAHMKIVYVKERTRMCKKCMYQVFADTRECEDVNTTLADKKLLAYFIYNEMQKASIEEVFATLKIKEALLKHPKHYVHAKIFFMLANDTYKTLSMDLVSGEEYMEELVAAAAPIAEGSKIYKIELFGETDEPQITWT
jgi:monomeric isocitrate dehydrogenase